MTLDVRRFRQETPGTETRIHLNNAGAALMPLPVLQSVRDHLALEAQVGGYEAADLRRDAVAEVYRQVAGLLGGEPHQVALTEHATASFVAALSSIPFRPGDVLVTTRHDYVSNQIQYLSLARRMGVEVVRAPDAPEGGVDLEALRALIHRRRPRLVAMSQIPTNSGLVQDVAAVGRICREKDVWFLVDACQSVGQMPVDVTTLAADFVAGTARKFLRGPRGAGFLWVSDRVLEGELEPLFPDLRGADWIEADLYQPAPDATRFESWEFAYALVLGMGRAARYAREVGMEAIQVRVRRLAALLREGLAGIPGARVLDRGGELCAIVTVHLPGPGPSEWVAGLRERGVNTSALDRSAAVLDFDEKEVPGALRLSPHYYNTDEEIDVALDHIRSMAG